MKTIQATTTNLIIQMARNPKIKEKLLAEILPVMEKAKENILEKLDYDSVMDLEYLPKCFYETLRINPPIPMSSISNFYQ